MAISLDVSAAAGEALKLLAALWELLQTGKDGPASNGNKGANDAVVAIIFATGIFAINWLSRLLIAEPVSRRWLLPRERDGKPPTYAKVQKFGQSFIEALFYGLSFAVGYVVVMNQPWVWPSKDWWQGMKDGQHGHFSDALKCYYLLYFGRYLQAVLSVLMEHKRKDFLEMQIHHLTTLLLIFLSYNHQYVRVGAVVMVLLDPADVPLHIAKMVKYCDYTAAADALFAVFMVVFFCTRLVLYPYVCWSAHIEANRYFEYHTAEWMCIGLLYLLMVLQIYWFGLIVKVVIRLFKGLSVEDLRSDDEDDDAEPKNSSKRLRKSPGKVQGKGD